MRKSLFIGLVVTAVVLVSGCYGPTTGPNATVLPTGGTPVETVAPIETATPVVITTVTETPYATGTGMAISTETATAMGTVTGGGIATTPVSTYSYATTPAVTTTRTATANMTVVAVNAVDITSSGFNPAIISVPIGTQVTWTNRDSVPHAVKNTGFDSGTISPGNTFSRTFSTTGSYDYGDPSNPSWSGTVIVT